MGLDESFHRFAGHKRDLIPNLRAAGDMVHDFILLCLEKSSSSVVNVEYYFDMDDGLESHLSITYEINDDEAEDGGTYEGSIDLYPTGHLGMTMTRYDGEGKVLETNPKKYPLWVMADPDIVAQQAMYFLAEDPDDVLTGRGVGFYAPYEELMSAAGVTVETPTTEAPVDNAQKPPAKRSFWRPFG